MYRKMSPSLFKKHVPKYDSRESEEEEGIKYYIMKRVYDAGWGKIIQIRNYAFLRHIRGNGIRTISKKEYTRIMK